MENGVNKSILNKNVLFSEKILYFDLSLNSYVFGRCSNLASNYELLNKCNFYKRVKFHIEPYVFHPYMVQ